LRLLALIACVRLVFNRFQRHAFELETNFKTGAFSVKKKAFQRAAFTEGLRTPNTVPMSSGGALALFNSISMTDVHNAVMPLSCS
jgi:hypothetical protein